MWRIEFSSDKFLPYLPEEAQANPGVYGFELAQWLSVALAKRDIFTTYPLGEDWGWLVEPLDDEVEVLIGCSSVCGEGEGYEGTAIDWSIFVDLRRSMKQKLLGKSLQAPIGRIQDAILAVLSAEGIQIREVEV